MTGKNKIVTFHHPMAFWAGTVAIIVGVCTHFPMFIMSADLGYKMAGMPMDALMISGMFMIVLGLLGAWYGLKPRAGQSNHHRSGNVHGLTVRTMENVRLGKAHWALIATLLVAMIVDVMKPASLGFVVPGMRAEYGLSKSLIVVLPLSALTGTTLGSILWGMLADVLGRRASILLAGLIFIGTSICGAMPSYWWNVGMCFLMGMSAGGLLPIIFALMAETIPTRHRGWILVLLGAVGTAGGYLLTSVSASLLEPHFGWRIMWFLGLPTGLLLILLNRYIPESFRFLMAQGRHDEAHALMQHYGAILVKDPMAVTAISRPEPQPGIKVDLRDLFRRPYTGLTYGLLSSGVAWGLVNFGFVLWLPSNLRNLGLSVAATDAVLAKSALLALPGALLVTWLYHSWSTHKTFVLFTFLTAMVLMSFTLLGTGVLASGALLASLVVLLLISSNGIIAILLPYSAEIYPVQVRATGTGLAAASSKFGGVVGVILGLPILAPGLVASALVAAIPLSLAALGLALTGVETKGRRLEDIHLAHAGAVEVSS